MRTARYCLAILISLPFASCQRKASLSATPEPTPAVAEIGVFVDPQGSDTNDGRSLSTPVATIQHAADLAEPGDTIYIRKGTYRETIRPKKSGTAGKPIIFTSYRKEEVVVDGADPVTGWKPWKDGISVAPMRADWFSRATPGDGVHLYDPQVQNEADQVFVGDRMMLVARWPNTPSLDSAFPVKAQCDGFVSKTEDKATGWNTAVVTDKDLAELHVDPAGAEIMFQPNFKAWSWIFSGYVTGVEGNKLTFKTRSPAGKDFSQNVYDPASRYILFNSLALLDAPGEWYHDKAAGQLYLESPDGQPLEGRVRAKKRLYAFDLTDRSYITIRDLTITACTITTDHNTGGDNIPYDEKGQVRYPWLNPAHDSPKEPFHQGNYRDSKSTHVVLKNITATYVSHFTDMSGHFTCQWGQSSGIGLSGQDHSIEGCRIRWSAGNGITLLGRRNRAIGNVIEDTGYSANDTAAIHTGVTLRCSSDHEIGWNTIRRVGRSAVVPRNLYRSNSADGSFNFARIHHNDIADFGIQDWDLGGIYSSHDGRWLRIDHNWIHDAHENVDGLNAGAFSASGVYPDYGSRWIIENNVIWNVEWGIHLQNQDASRDASYVVRNNTVAVRSLAPQAQPYGPFGIVRNSDAKFAKTIVANNVLVLLDGSKGFKPLDFASDATLGRIVENSVAGSSFAEIDLTGGNRWPEALAPAAGSRLIDQSRVFEIASEADAPMPKEVPDEVVIGTTRDIGAIESGAPMWRAGHEALTHH